MKDINRDSICVEQVIKYGMTIQNLRIIISPNDLDDNGIKWQVVSPVFTPLYNSWHEAVEEGVKKIEAIPVTKMTIKDGYLCNCKNCNKKAFYYYTWPEQEEKQYICKKHGKHLKQVSEEELGMPLQLHAV